MRLFDFIEKDNGIRMTADFFRQLARIVIADIAGRRTDHSRNGVLLHKFRHIKPNQRVRRVEKVLRQHLDKLRFSDARRSRENKRSGLSLISHAGAAALDGTAYRIDRRVLPDNSFFETFGKAAQPFKFICRD